MGKLGMMNRMRRKLKKLNEIFCFLSKERIYYLPHYLYRKIKKYFYKKIIRNVFYINQFKKRGLRIAEKRLEYQNNVFIDEPEKCIRKISNALDCYIQVKEYAQNVLDNSFYVMNEHIKDCYKNGHYIWKESCNTSSSGESTNCIDIKYVWEFARMQYLIAPAICYAITGDDIYAQKVKGIISDFIECNPYGVGKNYMVSMEVGIRISNMVLAYELIRNAECVDDNFKLIFSKSVYEHYRYIVNNRENVGGKTYNHYLGGLLGEAVCCSYFSGIRKYRKRLCKVRKSLEREIRVQLLEDGVDFEGSTYYHRFVGEMISYTALILKRHKLPIQLKYQKKVIKMTEMVRALMNDEGYVPQIGDNDSGRVFQLLPNHLIDNRSFINLVYSIFRNEVLFDITDEVTLFLNENIRVNNDTEKKQEYYFAQQAKLGKFNIGKMKLFITAMDAERNRMVAHTHNDLMSFQIWVGNIPVIVDPGTGSYTGDKLIRKQFRSSAMHSVVMVDNEEQRDFHSKDVFKYDYKAYLSTVLKLKDKGIYGEIWKGKNKEQEREVICNREEEIIYITDTQIAEYKVLTMTLCLDPNVTVDISKDEIYLNNGMAKVKIQGSWNYRVEDTIFSPAYNLIVPTKKIVCESYNKDNYLKITVE